MTHMTPLRRRNLRRRRKPPTLRWSHILGVVLGLIPLAVILHHNHFDACSPISWEDCSRG